MRELFAGSLTVGLPLSNPLLQSSFTRGFHGGPSTNGLPVLVIDPRLVRHDAKEALLSVHVR